MNTSRQRVHILKVLQALRDWGEPILKTELIMLIEEEQNYSYFVGLLDGLCFGGFIHYDYSKADARLCFIEITPGGLEHLRMFDEVPF